MKRTELIGSHNKIAFLFNGSAINFGDQTPVETYFKRTLNPKIIVNLINNYSVNWCNWIKEEEERIIKEKEIIELEIQA